MNYRLLVEVLRLIHQGASASLSCEENCLNYSHLLQYNGVSLVLLGEIIDGVPHSQVARCEITKESDQSVVPLHTLYPLAVVCAEVEVRSGVSFPGGPVGDLLSRFRLYRDEPYLQRHELQLLSKVEYIFVHLVLHVVE